MERSEKLPTTSSWGDWARAGECSPDDEGDDDEFGVKLNWPNGTPPRRRRRPAQSDDDLNDRAISDSPAEPTDHQAFSDHAMPMLPLLASSIDELQAVVRSLAGRIKAQEAASASTVDRLLSGLVALETATAGQDRLLSRLEELEAATAGQDQLLSRLDRRMDITETSDERVLSTVQSGIDAVKQDLSLLRADVAQLREELATIKKRVPVRARAAGDRAQVAQLAAAVREHLAVDDLCDRVADTVIGRLLEVVDVVEAGVDPVATPLHRPTLAPGRD